MYFNVEGRLLLMGLVTSEVDFCRAISFVTCEDCLDQFAGSCRCFGHLEMPEVTGLIKIPVGKYQIRSAVGRRYSDHLESQRKFRSLLISFLLFMNDKLKM